MEGEGKGEEDGAYDAGSEEHLRCLNGNLVEQNVCRGMARSSDGSYGMDVIVRDVVTDFVSFGARGTMFDVGTYTLGLKYLMNVAAPPGSASQTL